MLRIRTRLAGASLADPLIHADGAPLPALPLGDDVMFALGQENAILLGYPGVSQTLTVTNGIYSAYSPDGEWLITDTTMLPGHSGGPGLNTRGVVVGW